MKQSEILLTSEGDAWYARNLAKVRDDDMVLREIAKNPNLKPRDVLEIGCGTGWRLNKLYAENRDARYSGIDASWKAINQGKAKFSKINLRVGTADNLGYPDNSFDLVILGFFLYLVDREDLFKVVMEIDRVLKDKGALIIHDFTADTAHSAAYKHDPRLKTYKMNYWNLWHANPAYTTEQFHLTPEEAIVTLRKNIENGWPLRA